MTVVSGRSFLVTGASGALGSRVAARLGAAGAALTLTGRDPGRLAATATTTTSTTARPVVLSLDLTLPGSGDRAVTAAVAAHGALDGVVHTAGVVAFGPVDTLDDDVLDELLLLNTVAPIRLLRAAVPHLRASAAAGRDPVVCHVSAVVAERALPGMAAYSASKAALTAFDAAAGAELRRAGIRVVDARPPHTETGLAHRPVAGEAPRLPRGRDPDAVADRIVAALVAGERDLPAAAF
ncbi:MAG: SDR family NAD(P)-dependent oxidoreductase [Kineosporiaceae bacterium]